ncbi:MAG TPA: helix-hairpin-helix domain-containing protein [Anaerolineales bacterium]|jgi:predicted flap endonuclease-1-like 5' DNA nuclease|nr:helix-hairpin-helix domain-containing protein [Anaerolineales bacterium]
MRAFKVFIFGLLYGWFFKIAFDRIYRGNEIDDVRNENASLRDYIRSLEMQLQPKSLETKSLQRTTPEAPRAEIPAERQETSAPALTQETSEKDDLKVIKGIGPAIERKLNSAGIHSFAALSQLSAADLENILGNQVKRLQDENDLIRQAKRLAKKK